jgi:hypothetical protein
MTNPIGRGSIQVHPLVSSNIAMKNSMLFFAMEVEKWKQKNLEMMDCPASLDYLRASKIVTVTRHQGS